MILSIYIIVCNSESTTNYYIKSVLDLCFSHLKRSRQIEKMFILEAFL